MRYTIQVDPPIHPAFWTPGETPHWHFCVWANSPEAALAVMKHSECRNMPMRVVPSLG